MENDPINHFAKKFSSIYSISHAFWRTWEANLLNKEEFKFPLLDLGCGDATFLSLLFENRYHNQEIIGLDINEIECAKARKKGFYREVICAPSDNIPLPNEKFKMVFSNCVLEHIKNLADTFGEANRVLEPGGYFLFTALSDSMGKNLFFTRLFEKIGLKSFGKKYAEFVNGIFKHYNLLSASGWEAMAAKEGFKMIKAIPIISEKSEKYFDLFLLISSIQQLYVKKIGGTLPLAQINFRLVDFLISRCKAEELGANRGANFLILLQKI